MDSLFTFAELHRIILTRFSRSHNLQGISWLVAPEATVSYAHQHLPTTQPSKTSPRHRSTGHRKLRPFHISIAFTSPKLSLSICRDFCSIYLSGYFLWLFWRTIKGPFNLSVKKKNGSRCYSVLAWRISSGRNKKPGSWSRRCPAYGPDVTSIIKQISTHIM